MRLNLVQKLDAPEPPYETVMVCLAPKLIPHIFYGMWLKSQRYFWNDLGQWQTSRRLLAEQASTMLESCSRAITNNQEALYNLLDATLRGTLRTVVGTGTDDDPFFYSPPIQQTVTPEPGVDPSVLAYLEKANQIQDNALNGTAYADLPNVRAIRTQLEEILAALGGDTADLGTIISQLASIIAALA